MRPAYITATRRQTLATRPRSWLIIRMAVPRSAHRFAHQLDDLRLHGHVERGGRLVGDQEIRPAGERDGDHHALPHAAGKLVRVILHPPLGCGDADARQRLDRQLVGFPPVLALVQHEHLGDLPADRRDRIERRHRLLEDHGDAIAAQRALLGRRKAAGSPGRQTGWRRRRSTAAGATGRSGRAP